MKSFIEFLQRKVYQSIEIPEEIIEIAFNKTVLDVNYHFPNLSRTDIKQRVQENSNELAIFLYRLGNELHVSNAETLKPQIHWLLKELCSCEIYFNNDIGVGFYVVHGEGTVLGSRNKIGKGFKIHHGCTIGHKKNNYGKGNVLGDNVTMYANSSIIGELNIGDNAVIGAHVLVFNSILKDEIRLNK